VKLHLLMVMLLPPLPVAVMEPEVLLELAAEQLAAAEMQTMFAAAVVVIVGLGIHQADRQHQRLIGQGQHLLHLAAASVAVPSVPFQLQTKAMSV